MLTLHVVLHADVHSWKKKKAGGCPMTPGLFALAHGTWMTSLRHTCKVTHQLSNTNGIDCLILQIDGQTDRQTHSLQWQIVLKQTERQTGARSESDWQAYMLCHCQRLRGTETRLPALYVYNMTLIMWRNFKDAWWVPKKNVFLCACIHALLWIVPLFECILRKIQRQTVKKFQQRLNK